ncbi:YicC/YloC family endoribonuclease [Hyphobacterium sp. HN65]|uniref:YicC/YloC family endoribonuclease n=1 Tax=Hyphobacterium lacteum TaxID=3116575 RepID=A0ABU7LLL4_9PROT|nr:YicC/YloC family endoribonuclease [Hyphobacterium sp. HN65]MEE2524773.1 YicC/YloC family endoribonuclease [Hyphobacterium sp. HN65]
MTGFARAVATHGGCTITWEIKSVNGKGLEVRFRTPPGFDALELAARDRAKTAFARGSLQAGLTITREASEAGIVIDSDKLQALIDASRPFVERGEASPPAFDGLLAIRGVLKGEDDCADDDREGLEKAVLVTFDEALSALKSARREEGAALSGILSTVLDEITALRDQAADVAAARPEAMRDKFAAKLADLLDGDLPEDRLAQEAAILAVKADIREELDRLTAHIDSARILLDGGSPVGRKLDFLSQEFNREVNTLCSKSGDSELTRIGLALKASVDQFREQIQNVE